MVRAPLASLRVRAARKAADRALHATALRGAPDDPYILARLGLYRLALTHEPRDAEGVFGQLLAKTALGRIGALRDAGPLDRRKKHLLARALAPHTPLAAIKYLGDQDIAARAACLCAAGRFGEAEILPAASDSETSALHAQIAARQERWRDARSHLNAIFSWSNLSAPLDLSDDPVTVDDFQSRVLLPRHGPLVSIIIPFHNAAATLETAVRSVCEQSWRDIEILLIDDRSDDEGPALAAKLSEQDQRIRVLANARTPGVYGARNTGIDAASGEYVTFLDADDWSCAERIARLMDLLAKGGVAAVGHHIRIDEDGAPMAPRVFPIVRIMPITWLTRRDVVRQAGLFEEVKTGADSEMFARLETLHGRSAMRRDEAVLVVARWRPDSLSLTGDGGMFGSDRIDYRANWMFRHAGLEPPALAGDAPPIPERSDSIEENGH